MLRDTKFIRKREIALIFLTLTVVFCTSYAASEDNGSTLSSWNQKYIGKVKHAVFHTTTKGIKQIFVATEQNVVASLSLKTGNIYWRQTFKSSEEINALATVSEKYVLTLSGGKVLRAWSMVNGDLIWETTFPAFASQPTIDVTPIYLHHLKATLILVSGNVMLYGVSSIDGEILWITNKHTAGHDKSFTLQKVLTGEDKNSLYGVGFSKNNGFSLWKVYLFSGRAAVEEASTLKATICTNDLILTNHTLVALDCEGKTIYTAHIKEHAGFSISRTVVASIIPDAFGKAKLLETTLEGVFILRFTDQIVFVKIAPNGHELSVMEMFQRPAVISNRITLPLGKSALMLVQPVGSPDEPKLALRILLKDGETDTTISHILHVQHGRGQLEQVHFNGYIKKDGALGFRALLVMEDYSSLLLQDIQLVWSREDGLGSIQDVAFVELPKENTHVPISNAVPSPTSLLNMASFRRYLTPSKGTHGGKKEKESRKFVQDEHGFQKLLIVLTKPGKLFALHSGDGRIVWSLLVPLLSKSANKMKPVSLQVLLWQHSEESLISENPVILIIARYGTANSVSCSLAWIDAFTGRELYFYSLPYAIDDVNSLYLKTLVSENIYALTVPKSNLSIFPRSQNFHIEGQGIVIPTVDFEEGIVSGYDIDGYADNMEIPLAYCFHLRRTWKLDFSQSSERVLASSGQMSIEVDSGRVKLNKETHSSNIQSKQLMIVVTTVENSKSAEGMELIVHVIDSETGKIVEKAHHLNSHGDVHLVNGQDWFAYGYYDMKSHHYKIVLGKFGRTDEVNNKDLGWSIKSSRTEQNIEVLNKNTITFMKAIEGSDGHSQLLFGTNDGKILSSDINLGCHWRKNNSKTIGQLPELSRGPLQEANFTKTNRLEGLRQLKSMPTKHLNRNLVFAYGVDMCLYHVNLPESPCSNKESYSNAVLIVTIGITLAIALLPKVLLKYLRNKYITYSSCKFQVIDGS